MNEMEGSVEFENASIGFGRREWGGFVVETIDLRRGRKFGLVYAGKPGKED